MPIFGDDSTQEVARSVTQSDITLINPNFDRPPPEVADSVNQLTKAYLSSLRNIKLAAQFKMYYKDGFELPYNVIDNLAYEAPQYSITKVYLHVTDTIREESIRLV